MSIDMRESQQAMLNVTSQFSKMNTQDKANDVSGAARQSVLDYTEMEKSTDEITNILFSMTKQTQ
jgi:hypothetical protein